MNSKKMIAFEQFQNELYDLFYVEEKLEINSVISCLLSNFHKNLNLSDASELLGLSQRELVSEYDFYLGGRLGLNE